MLTKYHHPSYKVHKSAFHKLGFIMAESDYDGSSLNLEPKHFLGSSPSTHFECSSSTEDVIIDDITEAESTSAILNNCKKRFLIPYIHILGAMGLRPQGSSRCHWQTIFGHLQTMIILTMILFGYCLQYLYKFRRDRGYGMDEIVLNFHELFHEGGFFIYILPSVLHFIGTLWAIFVFKIRDSEQFQSLIERVFIITNCSKTLVYNLWSYFAYGLLWLGFSASSSFLMTNQEHQNIEMNWFGGITTDTMRKFLKVMLILTITIHDLIQIIIVICYCIQCCLLRNYCYKLKERLLHHTIEPLEWMREISEFKKLVKFLNRNLAIPICFFLILNVIYSLSGTIFIINIFNNELFIGKLTSNICNSLAWVLLTLVPFYQAAKLNEVCRSIKFSGHEIRVRPFVHHNTSTEDLDSILLFASSLKIATKLFHIPVRGSYLCFCVACLVISVLTWGMCYN